MAIKNMEKCDISVSVVVPVYHLENYIERCIRSLLRQSLQDVEFLFVCEKKDPAYQIIEAYEKRDARVRLIEHRNEGVSASRNAGLDFCRGKYVMFVDGDDWIEPDTLRVLYENAEQECAEVVVCGIWPSIEPKRGQIGIYQYSVRENVLYDDHSIKALFFERGSRPYIGNKFYLRDLLAQDRIFFREDMAVAEDQFFQFQVFRKAKRVLYLREKLYHYDIARPGSAMNTHEREKKLLRGNLYFLEQVLDFWKKTSFAADKDMVWWILDEFGYCLCGVTSDECVSAAEKIMQALQSAGAEKCIQELPAEYRECYRRIQYAAGSAYCEAEEGLPQGGASRVYQCPLSTEASNRYRSEQTKDLKQRIEPACRSRIRRVREAFAFHEGRRLFFRVLRKIGVKR